MAFIKQAIIINPTLKDLTIYLTDVCSNACVFCLGEELNPSELLKKALGSDEENIRNFFRMVNWLQTETGAVESLNSLKMHNLKSPKRPEMTAGEIGQLVDVSTYFGVKDVKLSARRGEPLLRNDITDIVERVSSNEKIEDISLTTNGTLLKENAEKLKQSGLSRIRVSLPSIDPDKYRRLTGCGNLETVKAGIEESLRVKLPTKINFPILGDLNSEEIPSVIAYARGIEASVQLIDYYSSLGLGRGFKVRRSQRDGVFTVISRSVIDYTTDLEGVRRYLSSGAITTRRKRPHETVYVWPGVEIELMEYPCGKGKCYNCRESFGLTIDCNGRILTCGMGDKYVDSNVRSGNEKRIRFALEEAIGLMGTGKINLPV